MALRQMDNSRYAEKTRGPEDKYLGPLVKTIMNRCIHCNALRSLHH